MPLSDHRRQQLFDLLRVLITLCAVALAAWVTHWVWTQQRAHPWTRDGQVRANLVRVAPQVAGPVVAVHVVDNQRVEKGALLFEIDPTLFRQALSQAQADLVQAQAQAQDAQADAARATRLHQSGDLADQDYDLKVAKAKASVAAVDSAKVALKTAELKLGYTKVRAPASGFITNLNLDVGTFAAAGTPLIALVDESSFWVAGYFKETDLRAIAIGDPAQVRLMAAPDRPLAGTVESIAFGIAERNVGAQLGELAPVAPTFEWIRLAQRIPVRIALTERPADVPLRIGYTASVGINPTGAGPRPGSPVSRPAGAGSD